MIYCQHARGEMTFNDPFFLFLLFLNSEIPRLPNVIFTSTMILIFVLSKLQTYYILQIYQLLPIYGHLTANCRYKALAPRCHGAWCAHLAATSPFSDCISLPDRCCIWLAQKVHKQSPQGFCSLCSIHSEINFTSLPSPTRSSCSVC